MGDDLPSSHNITIFCPRTGHKSTKWIMNLIKKQNDLDSENWRLISRKNEDGGLLLSLGIDDNSCAKIISSDHRDMLVFLLGSQFFCCWVGVVSLLNPRWCILEGCLTPFSLFAIRVSICFTTYSEYIPFSWSRSLCVQFVCVRTFSPNVFRE